MAEENDGSIDLIVGPMWSGKSSELLRRVRRSSLAHMKTVIVKHISDTRYSATNFSTHDGIQVQAIAAKMMENVYSTLLDYDLIAIDEGQFFTDIVKYSKLLCQNGKKVIIAMLNSDFQMKAFTGTEELYALCDNLKKLSAVCAICFKKANFTKKKVDDDSITVGGSEYYMAVCRKCFHAH